MNKLIKIRSQTNEVELSSFCFFNEKELEQIGITLNTPFNQNGITYEYQLLKGE